MQDLPIGISEFTELRETNCLYIDKTKYVYSLLKKNRRTFLARPRRFGKSLLVSTLDAALQGEKELFEGLWIANSDYSFEPKGVIRLDFSQLSIENIEAFKQSLFLRLQSIANSYGITLAENLNVNSALDVLIETLCPIKNKRAKTKESSAPIEIPSDEENATFKSVAILIDEYDHPILHTLHNTALAIDIRNLMKSFSGVIKAQAKRVKFVFVTGVSAFSKSGLSSGLNNLTNLTINTQFSGVCGYTDEEVDFYFKEHMEHWAMEREIPYETLREQLRTWYNGYCFKENTQTIYSPFSFTSAMEIQELRNFWFESATPQFLLDELAKAERQEECNFLNLDDLEGNVSLLQTFEIECIPLTALLFQMGYLTIKSYNALTRFYQLKYPNLEVKTALHCHLLTALAKTSLSALNSIMSKLFSSLLEENMEQFIHCLMSVFSNIPYQLHGKEKHAEHFYHAILQALFIASGIKSQAEYSTSQGRADIIVELPKLIYIIEVKVNKKPEEGLQQIETQQYYQPFLHLGKPVRAIGLSFHRRKESEKEKSHFSITHVTKKL